MPLSQLDEHLVLYLSCLHIRVICRYHKVSVFKTSERVKLQTGLELFLPLKVRTICGHKHNEGIVV